MPQFKNKKRLGQNFLENPELLAKIGDLADLDAQTDALEIGVGAANLTTILASQARRVLGFELDLSLIPLLEKKLKNYPNVYLAFEDVLKVDLKAEIAKILPNSQRIVAIGNIPYYISSSIIHLLLDSEIPFERIILMVQKEVAQKIIAAPNTSNYKVLSLYVQEFAKTKIVLNVGKNNFRPVPKVDSAVIMLQLKPNRLPLVQIKKEMKFIELAFSNRRKQLKNNLSVLIKQPDQQQQIKQILTNLFNNSQIRAQELSLTQYRLLISELQKALIL